VSTVTLHLGDVRDVMATLPDNCADVLITSPPFLALRSYLPADHPDKHRELGSEPTPAAFLDSLYGLTQDWGRLVPKWGSICVELGDTMSGVGVFTTDDPKTPHRNGVSRGGQHGPGWPLAKSMCLIPHLYTIGLAYGHNPLTGQSHQAGQWRIRNVITWARPNPPVGSLGKRNPTKRTGDQKFRPACSYITVACRGTGRYFDLDAVRTESADTPTIVRVGQASASRGISGGDSGNPDKARMSHNPAGAPPLDWHQELDGDWLWKLATAPYPGAHYATYPLTLPRRLILAMCPARVCTVCGWPSERIVHDEGQPPGRRQYRAINGQLSVDTGTSRNVSTLGWSDCGHNTWRPGTVLDPFAGSGTTAVAAALENRDCILIDIDARSVELVDRRLREALHVTSYTVDGNVHTWQLEPALPDQRQQLDGQGTMLDLFDEGVAS
jgi:site-specific DNA-methyltransferase (adenine-specific)